MIRVITPERYSQNAALLRQMHRLRYRVFKQRLDWDVETVGDEEHDHYDRLDPFYVMVLDDDEDVVGCWRALPTTGPNMLRDVFPQLLGDRPLPDSPAIWECSRFALDCPSGGENCLATVNSLTSALFCGLIHHCIERGIEQVVTVYDIRIARILPRVGVRPIWRTKPQRVGSVSALVGLFEISEAVLDSVLEHAGFLGLNDQGEGCLEPITGLRPMAALSGAEVPVHVG